MQRQTIYDDEIEFGEKIEQLRRNTKIVTHVSETDRISTRQNIMTYLIHPALGYDLANLIMFKGEIPSGKHTGKHRHMSDAAIYVLSGKGYSIVEDQKHEWSEGDAMYIPSWTWHQHFNTDPDKPVIYLACTTNPILKKVGLFKIEQGEDKNY